MDAPPAGVKRGGAADGLDKRYCEGIVLKTPLHLAQRVEQTMRPTIRLLSIVLALAPLSRADAAPLRFCQEAAAKLKADSDLAGAARAAFGQPGFTNDENCRYPLQVVRYADVDVLLSQSQAPGEACHGCEAELSATVLKRIPGGYKSLRTFEAFGKMGSHGAVASISPIAIGGDDGLAIEAGGTFQGYTNTTLDLFAFRRQGLVHLESGGPLYLSGDNSGAEIDQSKSKTIAIESAWSIGNGELALDYRIDDGQGQRQSRAVWTVGETQLTLKSGAIPKEMGRAVGME
jgi:hypothetical protein